jgi:diaminobutyrate acetyltransferase
MIIVNPSKKEFMDVQKFVGKCNGLVQHPGHFYKILTEYFGGSFFVAKENGKIVGFTFGFQSQEDEDIFFMWQIGVDRNQRKKGIGKALVDKVIEYAEDNDCKKVHATVETKNRPSQKLFESKGFYNISAENGHKVVKENGKNAILNYYGSGTNQILYELDLVESRLIPSNKMT